MGCKYLVKCLNGQFKCKKKNRGIIYYIDCKNCLDFILVRNKGIKKVGAKRVFVKKEVYNKVYERDKGECQLCGNDKVQLHHIVYRGEDKSLINEPSNCIMLCVECHNKVHSNKEKWQPILKNIVKEKSNE